MKNTKLQLKRRVSVLLSFVMLFGLFSVFSAPTPAEALTCNSATLTGTVNTNMPPTDAWFEWAKNRSNVESGAGNRTPIQTFNSAGNFPVEAFINGLQENTTYHYRLVARDRFGTEFGAIKSFTTP